MGKPAQFWSDANERGFGSVFALDFEGGNRTGVVEYGVVEITSEGLGRVWTDLCAPAAAVPLRESDTHGLYQEDLSGKAPFSDHWELFRDLRRQGPFLAHSAQVEDRFLRRQWRTPGAVPDWKEPGESGIEWGPWLDSCGLFRTISPSKPAGLGPLIAEENLLDRLSEESVARCPENRSKWHSALYDTLASALLFERAIQYREDWSLRRFFRESASSGGAESEQLGLL